MKVINLDRFKNVQKVEIEGIEYTVRGFTVDMFLNDPVLANLDSAEGKARIAIIVQLMEKLSDIPVEVLMEQSLDLLTALMSVIQGNDPNDQFEKEAEKVPNE